MQESVSRWAVVLGTVALTAACGRPVATIAVSPSPAPTAAAIQSDIAVVNPTTPGQKVELGEHVVKGKTTLFEFYSTHCSACKEMDPILKYLSRRRGGLAIRQVLIDRPSATDIDFDSPVAEQFRLQITPSFRVHDPSGALIAEGAEAKALVRTWYQEEQSLDHLGRIPRPSDRSRSTN